MVLSNPEAVFDHVQRPVLMIGRLYARQLTCNAERNEKGTVRHDTFLRVRFSRRAGIPTRDPTRFCMQPDVKSI